MSKVISVVVTLFALMASTCARASITLSPFFADNMVLQRDTSNLLLGHTDEATSIKVLMDGMLIASSNISPGNWQISIPPHKAGGPHKLEIIAPEQHLIIQNLLFGDLWLASGQSNMEYTLGTPGGNYHKDLQTLSLGEVRQFRVNRNAAYQGPLHTLSEGSWSVAESEALNDFSAVGYFFAKHLYSHTHVPIGIVNNAFAGSRIQAWLSEEALIDYPEEAVLITRNKNSEQIELLQKQDDLRYQQWQRELTTHDLGLRHNWYTEEVKDTQWPQLSVPGFWAHQGEAPFSGSMWFRKRIWVSSSQAEQRAVLTLGRIVDEDDVYINGHKVGRTQYQYPQRQYTLEPGTLRVGENTIVVRVVSHRAEPAGFVSAKPYQINFADSHISLSGLWRYQVGYRMKRALPKPMFKVNEQPSALYNAMMAPLSTIQLKGVIWYQGESNANDPDNYEVLFPLLIKQLRNQFSQPKLPFIFVQLANYLNAQQNPSQAGWADIRHAQSKGTRLKNTAMVTAIDLGEWNDIHPKDKASVGERLANAALNTVYKHPDAYYRGPLLTCAEKLGEHEIIVHSIFTPLITKGEGKTVHGFAVSENGDRYRWVEGKLQPNAVVLEVEHADTIKYISYAWQSNPSRANLYNDKGLPAYPANLSVNDKCKTGP